MERKVRLMRMILVVLLGAILILSLVGCSSSSGGRHANGGGAPHVGGSGGIHVGGNGGIHINTGSMHVSGGSSGGGSHSGGGSGGSHKGG